MFNSRRYSLPCAFLAVVFVAGALPFSVASCSSEAVSPDVLPEVKDEKGTELSFDAALCCVKDGNVSMTVMLDMGAESGLYSIDAECFSSEGSSILSRSGCLNLVAGVPRQLSLPLKGEDDGRLVEVTLSREGAECVRSVDLSGVDFGRYIVVSGGTPSMFEVPVGEVTVLPRSVVPCGFADDAEVSVSGSVEVSVDDFGIGVKPRMAGESQLVILSGGVKSTVTLKAVKGAAAVSVVLPERIVLLSGGQGAVVAETVPYGASIDGCSWSVDNGTCIGLRTDGPVAYLSGLAPGTARLSFSSPVGKAVTEVTVLEAASLNRVSRVILPKKVSLKAGRTSSLNVKYEPSDAVVGRVAWSVSDEDVVELTPSDLSCGMRGLRAGTAIVTVDIDGVRSSVNVNVTDAGKESGESVEPTGDVDMPENIVVLVGGEAAVVARTGDDLRPEDCSWSVMPEGCLEIVRTDGSVAFVRGLKNGRVDLVFRAGSSVGVSHVRLVGGDDSETPEDPEEDVDALESIMLTATRTSFKVGETVSVTASFFPEDYMPENFFWSMSPEGIVNLVPDGLTADVIGVSAGTVSVTFEADGKRETTQLSVSNPEPPYTVSINGSEFFVGQDVSLSFAGSAEEDVDTEVKLDGSSLVFNASGMTIGNLAPGNHKITVVQKKSLYVLDSREFDFSVYALPSPSVEVRSEKYFENFSSYVCIRKGHTVSVSVKCPEVDSFEFNALSGSTSILTASGNSVYCFKTGEGSIWWKARKGSAFVEGSIPVVVYDAVTVHVSAYLKTLSAESCYITLEVLSNEYGSVNAKNVVLEPYYKMLLPDEQMLTYDGETIHAGDVSLAMGENNEWSVGNDAIVCQEKVSAAGYNISDVSTVFITLKASGVLSDEYLVLEGRSGEITGCITGGNQYLKDYFKNR